MWIKTRVGLISITEPTEILVHQHSKDCRWSVYARPKVVPEMGMTNVLGIRKRTVMNPSSHLAIFSDRPGVSEAIGECMAKIEGAIRAKVDLCDLSQSGDAEAWGKAWQQIQWPG